MYVAIQRLKVPQGYIEPGEPVPQASSWSPLVLRAHLNWKKIKEVPDKAATPRRGQPRKKKGQKRGVVLRTSKDGQR